MGLSDLDQRLYFHYLDGLAFIQGSIAARWVIAFLSTLATECFVLGLMLGSHYFPRVVKAGLIANLATHPVFWYFLVGIEQDYAIWVVISELVIAAVESIIIFLVLGDIRWRYALLLSLAANGASFFLGLARGIC